LQRPVRWLGGPIVLQELRLVQLTVQSKSTARIPGKRPAEGDPPVFVYHRKRQDVPGNIHHVNFGRHLKELMDELGIQCIHRIDADYDTPQGQWKDVFEFVKRPFGITEE